MASRAALAWTRSAGALGESASTTADSRYQASSRAGVASVSDRVERRPRSVAAKSKARLPQLKTSAGFTSPVWQVMAERSTRESHPVGAGEPSLDLLAVAASVQSRYE